MQQFTASRQFLDHNRVIYVKAGREFDGALLLNIFSLGFTFSRSSGTTLEAAYPVRVRFSLTPLFLSYPAARLRAARRHYFRGTWRRRRGRSVRASFNAWHAKFGTFCVHDAPDF